MSFWKRFFSRVENSKDDSLVPFNTDDNELEIEFCPPIKSGSCSCCGGVTTTLNRLIKRSGRPYAMCRITFSETHLTDPARGIVGIGSFGEGTIPDQRVAFAVSLKPEGVMVVDATDAEWPNSEILGPKLTRAIALRDQRKSELFKLIDQLYAEDSELNEHFTRVVSDTK